MSEASPLPQPPALAQQVFQALEDKAALPPATQLVLGLLAGLYIGFGGLFATVALAGAQDLPFGVGQVLAGLVFSAGLALVLIAGAELFTGNMLMVGPWAAGRLGVTQVLGALGLVYAANFLGSLLLAVLVLAAGVHEAGAGAVGQAALDLAATKTGNGFLPTLASGVLANMLVCLGVWLAYGGRTVVEKIAGLILPIAAFVAAGLEHSVANMYLLPYGLMVQAVTGQAEAGLSLGSIAANLVPATLGNMMGGALVALAYWAAFLRTGRPA
ncbi:formate/nitrite transporter family protein [Aquabacter sp. P-9]|uniref:formate/nitrite transporter family protein n=1 Tax=Aquabacter sediminis TaxID=3029197 RepID=UPI00237D77CF|nr:formate/nitrite transporter family protein [Aquabacter sp. P-9]MDE1567139.1 formate/nitrite transporter family protein [Aquabacter sp. P-9]